MAEPNAGGPAAPVGRLPWRRVAPAQPTAPTAEEVAHRGPATEDPAAEAPAASYPAADHRPPSSPGPEPADRPRIIEDTPAPAYGLEPIRLAALGLALVLAIAITMVKLFVAGPPSVDQLRAQAGVDSWTELTVGVKDDQPGVAYRDPGTQIWSGFDIDIAYMIAEDLGFRRDEVKFFAIESEDRARMQATGPSGRVPVKMVIASYSITPARENATGVTFSAPYLFTEQSVMTLADHRAVATLDDLAYKKVCTLSTSTSVAAPENAHAVLSRKNRIIECFHELDTGNVEAVTTDAAILAGYKAKFGDKYKHWDLGLETTEAWGVNVGENRALKTLVDLTLYHSLRDPKDHRWEDAYQRNLQVEVKQNKETPIAVAQQPDVPKPNVRELPWQEGP
jgi:ABC-type amino acid transport substrate-binding protein